MTRTTSCLAALVLFAFSAAVLSARRVAGGSNPVANYVIHPSRPPVLGGTTRTPGSQH